MNTHDKGCPWFYCHNPADRRCTCGFFHQLGRYADGAAKAICSTCGDSLKIKKTMPGTEGREYTEPCPECPPPVNEDMEENERQIRIALHCEEKGGET